MTTRAWYADANFVGDDSEKFIVTCHGDDGEANARLIAAAPDLLAALRQIAVLAEYRTTGPGKCRSDALTAAQATSLRLSISDIARAAIKAAEEGK